MADRYDDIVVGGGSAGCVIAARLAEAGRKVLLLEAGPDRTTAITPALRDGFGLPRGADWPDDWGYRSEPSATGETGPLRRGRLLGGTSWLTRFAVRGSTAELDGWAAEGLTGWAFEDLLPSFRRIEADADFGSEPWHGSSGPLPIDRYRSRSLDPVHQATVDALVAAGFEALDDHNRPGAIGVGRMPMSSRDGQRVSAADAFLGPGGARDAGLVIRPDSLVDRVTFDGDRATGVRLADGSALGADRVILSAGVFGSPGLLLRSGIGPAADLRALGIQVIGDLPGVGGNLADHPAVEVALDVDGPARTRPQLHSIASWHSSAADKAGTPDLLFWLADPIGDPAEFSIEVVLLKPRSRGRVTLRSRDAADPPSIQLPGVDRPEDAARLAEGVSLALAVAGGPDLAAVARPSPGSPGPGADLAAFVATEHYSIPHTVGTCAAGTSAENGAVVDSNGRVHGLSGLYVVDASILPEPLSGFPNLVTMAVAEAIAGRLGSATPTDT